MKRGAYVFALVIVAGCVRGTVAIMPVAPPTAPETTPGPTVRSTSHRLVWGNHEVQTPSCFFFSGPPLPANRVVNPLAEQFQVTHEGASLTIRIGETSFMGQGGPGPSQVVSERTFSSGGKWYVIETLDLDSGESPSRGTYHYRECPQSRPNCRSECTIDSDFSLQ